MSTTESCDVALDAARATDTDRPPAAPSAVAEAAPPLPSARILDYKGFLAVWLGQFLSAIGTQMTAFSLSIWVFESTSSVSRFGMVIAAQMAPMILFASLAGVVADRYDRRRIMIVCKFGAATVAMTTFVLLSKGVLTPITIGIATAVASVFAIIHQIAYAASVPMLVPKPLYQKANGLVQLSIHASAVVVPLIAVIAMEAIGISRVILIEFFCALLAMTSLLFARFGPMPQKSGNDAPRARGVRGALEAQTYGLRYVFSRPWLSALMVYLALASFINGFVYVLFRPMVLMLSDADTLGLLVTIAGFGGLAGAIFVGFASRFRDRVALLLWFSMLSGGCMILCGLTSSLLLIGVAAFGFSFSIPVAVVSVQTLLQSNVPPDVQGRVFSARALLASTMLLIAVLVSPFFAEEFFEPWLLDGGALANSLGSLFGVGPGRGIAVLFVIAGLVMIAMSLLTSRGAALRRLRADSIAADAAGS